MSRAGVTRRGRNGAWSRGASAALATLWRGKGGYCSKRSERRSHQRSRPSSHDCIVHLHALVPRTLSTATILVSRAAPVITSPRHTLICALAPSDPRPERHTVRARTCEPQTAFASVAPVASYPRRRRHLRHHRPRRTLPPPPSPPPYGQLGTPDPCEGATQSPRNPLKHCPQAASSSQCLIYELGM